MACCEGHGGLVNVLCHGWRWASVRPRRSRSRRWGRGTACGRASAARAWEARCCYRSTERREGRRGREARRGRTAASFDFVLVLVYRLARWEGEVGGRGGRWESLLGGRGGRCTRKRTMGCKTRPVIHVEERIGVAATAGAPLRRAPGGAVGLRRQVQAWAATGLQISSRAGN